MADRAAATGDWALVKARVVGRPVSGSDAIMMQTYSGCTFKAMPIDIAGVVRRPPGPDWTQVEMGQKVVVPDQGAGRFITRAEKNGAGMVLVLLDGQTEPGWFFEDRVQVA